MSTYLATQAPHCRPGPFAAFTATSRVPYITTGRTARVTVDGDPFFFTLNKLRMAINRLSSQSYPYYFDPTSNTIIQIYSKRDKKEKHRTLTADDFILEAVLFTPTFTTPFISDHHRDDTGPCTILNIPEPHP